MQFEPCNYANRGLVTFDFFLTLFFIYHFDQQIYASTGDFQ